MNELEVKRPKLDIDLDIELPELKPISHNLDIVEEWANELDKFYDKLVFTPEQYSEAKDERAKVNNLKKQIADNRIATIKEFKKPIDDFEATSKRIESILGAISTKIGQKIEVFDLKEKKIKEDKINSKIQEIREEYINDFSEYTKPLSELEIIFDNRWFNKTFKEKDLINDIREQFNTKIDDLDNFKKDAEAIVNYFNAIDIDHLLNKEKYIERYKYTRDLNVVLNDIKTDYDSATKTKTKSTIVEEENTVVDPFAGLSIEKEVKKIKVEVICTSDNIELLLKFIKDNNMEMREVE